LLLQRAEQQLETLLASEPERDFAAARCCEAWYDLTTERPVHPYGMGGSVVGAIPWRAMVAWCEFHELDRDSARTLVSVLRHLDVERSERETAQRAMEARAAARKVRR
jgi:hypothetical protein